MKAYIYPTDTQWAAFLRARPHLTEVNFWLPGRVAFRALTEGQQFVFKDKAAAGGRLIGGGIFTGFERLHVSEAWRFFGEANGSPSRAHLLARINHYRRSNGNPEEADPQIGCVMLSDTFFVPPEGTIPAPSDYRGSPTRGRSYSPTDEGWSQLEQAFVDLIWRAGIPYLRTDNGLSDVYQGDMFGIGGPTRVRRGQSWFQSRVTATYHRRCAITGGRISPTLQAAHILPVAHGGQHRLDNGLLLRSDVHTLFDAGYLGVNERHELQVSPHLRSDFGNGQEFYAKAGAMIALPDRAPDRPSREAVTWHMDTVFRH